MKVELVNHKFEPIEIKLTVENEQEARLLTGFLYLDVLDVAGAVLPDLTDETIHECISQLAVEIADDSTFEDATNAD